MNRINYVLTILLVFALSWSELISAQPSTQARFISFRNIGQNSVNIRWSNGNGTNRVVVVKPTSALGGDVLTDGGVVTADANFSGSGTTIDGTGKVVYNGNGNSVNVTGLTAGTTYHVKVYERDDTPDYQEANSTQNPRSFTTVAAAVGAPTSLALTAITGTSFDVSWGAGSNATGYITYLSKNAAFTDYSSPVDGYQEADLGNTTSFVFDGLTQNNSYYWRLYSTNSSGTSTAANYIANDADGRLAVLANEPSAGGLQITPTIPAGSNNHTLMNLSWSGGALNGTGTLNYLVLVEAGATVNGTPTDGVTYTGNADFVAAATLGGSKVVYYGTGTSVQVTNLTANTQYTYKVYAIQTNGFANNGNFSDKNYNATGASATRYTIPADPTAQASAPFINSLLDNGTGYDLSWSHGTATGTRNYVVIAKAGGTAPTYIPTDGTAITGHNLSFSSATTVNTNEKILYYGTANNISITGLSPKTQYSFAVYVVGEGTGGVEATNFLTTSPATATRYTLATPPTTMATAVTPAVSYSSLEGEIGKLAVSWTAGAIDGGNTLGHLVTARDNNGALGEALIDGQTYSANNLYTSAASVTTTDRIVGNLTGTSVTISNLTNAAITNFNVYAYSWDGTNAETINYGTAASGNRYTLETNPNAASALVRSAPTTTGMTVAWTPGASITENILIAALGTTNSDTPTEGVRVAAAADADFSTAQAVGSSQLLARQADGTGVAVTGLTAGTAYTYRVFSNRNTTDDATTNWNITNPPSATFYTLQTALADGDPDAITFTNLNSTSYTINVAGATVGATTRYLVVGVPGGTANTTDPTNGMNNYSGSANSTSTTIDWSGSFPVYSPNGSDAVGTKVLYDGTLPTTLTIYGLSPQTQYSFTVWAYSTVAGSNGQANNYDVDEVTATRYTLSSEQTLTAHGATTVVTPTATGGYTYSTAAATGTAATLGYITTLAPAGDVEVVPVDGTSYTTNLNYSTATVISGNVKVIYDNAAAPSSQAITNLADNTNYTIRTYVYRWDGTNVSTKNYLTTSNSSISRFTLATEPTAQSAAAATNRGTSTATLNWTNGNGANALVTLAQSANAMVTAVDDPVDGVYATPATVTSAQSFSSGSFLRTAEPSTNSTNAKVAYNGGAGTPATTIGVTGLSSNKRYDVEYSAYNGTTGSGAENYVAPVTNHFFTLSEESGSHTTNLAASVTANTLGQINLSWTPLSGFPADGSSYGYIVAVKEGTTAPSGVPVDGNTSYTADNSIDDNNDLDDDFGTNEAVVYIGSGNSVQVSGLKNATQYSFIVYTYTEGIDALTRNYYTPAGSQTITRYTLSTEPTGVGTPTIAHRTATEVGISAYATGAGSDWWLTTIRPSATASTIPVDGTVYSTVGPLALDTPFSSLQVLGGTRIMNYTSTTGTKYVIGLNSNSEYTIENFGANVLNPGCCGDEAVNYLTSTSGAISFFTLAAEPTTQASAVNISNRTATGFDVSWTVGAFAGTADGATLKSIVTVQPVAGTAVAPTDGTNYTASAAYNSASSTLGTTGGNEVVVFANTGNTVSVTGLANATSYIVRVYAYREGNTNTHNYLASPATANAFTLSSEPTAQPSAITVNTPTSAGNLTVAGLTYNATGSNQTLVSITPTASIGTAGNPVDGTYYNLTTTPLVNTAGTSVASSTFLWLNSTGGSVQVTGLADNTEYTFRAYAANRTNDNSDINYFLTTPTNVARYTLAAEPTTQASAVNISNRTATGFDVSWTVGAFAGTADGATLKSIVTVQPVAGTAVAPTDGTNYTASAAYNSASSTLGTTGGNEVVVFANTGNTVSVTGLANATSYIVRVYAYREGNTNTHNYLGTPATANAFTLSAEPTAQPSAITVNTPTTTGNLTVAGLTYNATGSNQTLVSITPTASIGTAGNPVDGTYYNLTTTPLVNTAGTSVPSSTFLWLNSTGGSVQVTGLADNTQYTFRAYAAQRTNDNSDINYFLTSPTNVARYTLATEPNAPATVSFANFANNGTNKTVTVNWTNNGTPGANTLVLLRAGSAPAAPTDGISEAAVTGSVDIGTAGDLTGNAGTKIIYNGSNATTSVNLTNLAASTNYHLAVYHYNGTTGTGAENYSTATTANAYSLANPNSVAGTLSGAPTLTIASNDATVGQITYSWSGGTVDQTLGYLLIVRNDGSDIGIHPTNGTEYTENTVYGSGAALGGGFVVYEGTGTNVTITGLNPAQLLSATLYTYNWDNANSGTKNYYGSGLNNFRQVASGDYTVATQPNAPSNVTFSTLGENGYNVAWDAASPVPTGGYMVVAIPGATASTGKGTDGTHVAAPGDANVTNSNAALGNGEVVYRGTGTSFSTTGLSAETEYTFAVYAYNRVTSDLTTNYNQTPATASRYSLAALPSVTTPVFTVNGQNPSGMTLNWSAAAYGADSLYIYGLTGNTPPATSVVTDGSSVTASPNTSSNLATSTLVYKGLAANGSQTLTGLSAGTYYSYRIFVANVNGENAAKAGQSHRYLASSTITAPTAAVEPTQNPSISTNSASLTTVNFTLTGGNGAKNLVSIKQWDASGDEVFSDPADVTTYGSTSNFSTTATNNALGNGTYITFNSSTTSMNGSISGLGSARRYVLRAYAYNDDNTAGLENYKQTAPGSTTFVTLATQPTGQASNINYFNASHNSSTSYSAYSVTFTAAAGASKYLVLGTQGSTPSTFTPTNSTSYSHNSDYNSAPLQGDGRVVYYGASTSFAVDGMIAGEEYTWKIISLNDQNTSMVSIPGSENYFATAAVSSRRSVAANPMIFLSTQAISRTTKTSGTISLAWPNATQSGGTQVTGYMVVGKANSVPTSTPQDGISYSGAAGFTGAPEIATGEKILYVGTGNSVNVTGLTSGQVYYFRVYSYYTVGGDLEIANYSGNSSTIGGQFAFLSGVFDPLAARPTVKPSSPAIASRAEAGTSVVTTWTSGNGASTLYAVAPQAASATFPAQGTQYTTGTTIGGTTVASFVGNASTTTTTLSSLQPATRYLGYVFAYNGTDSTANYDQTNNAIVDANDAATLDFVTLAAQPNPITSLSVVSKTTSAVELSWVKNNAADSVIIVARLSSSITTGPVDATNYIADLNFSGSGDALGSGKVVYFASANSATVTGLTANSNYVFSAFAVRGSVASVYGGVASSLNYNSTATNLTVKTLAEKPTVAPSGVNMPNANRAITAMRVAYTGGNGENVLIIASTNSAAPTIVNGETYAGGNLNFTSASTMTNNAGYKVIRNDAPGTQVDITGLLSNSQYYYWIYGYNGLGGAENYTLAATGNHWTLETQPTVVNSLTSTSNAGGTITLTYNNVDDNAKTLVLRRTGASPTLPTDGLVYSSTVDVNTTIAADVASNATDAKTTVVTGLTPGTSYTIDAISYNGEAKAGTSSETGGTNNYATSATPITLIARDSEPTVAPTVSATVSGTNAVISYTAGTGANKYLVLLSTNPINTAPVDGTTYVAGNTAYGGTTSTSFNASSGTTSILYNGTGTATFTVTGLPTTTQFNVSVYSYNDASGVSGAENYMATAGTTVFSTLSPEPTASPSAISVATPVTAGSLEVTGLTYNASGSNRTLLTATSTTLTEGEPVDGTFYNLTSNPSVFASGTALGNGRAVWLNSTGSSVTVSGLANNTQYTFRAYSAQRTSSDSDINYRQTSPTSVTRYSLSGEPTVGATGFAVNTDLTSTSQLSASWTASAFTPTDGSTVKYLVLAQSGASVPSDVQPDGSVVTAADNAFNTNQVITTAGQQVLYTGTGTSFTATGLSAGTQYTFKLITYAEGNSTETANYFATTSNSSATTLATEPSAPSLTAQGVSFSSASVSATGGGTGIVILYSTSPSISATFNDGQSYTAGTTVGSSTIGYAGATSSTYSISGLTASTTYFFQAYAFNGIGGHTNYNATPSGTISQTTATSPIPTSLAISSGSATNYNGANVNFVLQVRDQFGALATNATSSATLVMEVGSTTYTLGSGNATSGTLSLSNVNVRNLVNSGNGAINATLKAYSNTLTSNSAPATATVLAEDYASTKTTAIVSGITGGIRITGNHPNVASTGYAIWVRKGPSTGVYTMSAHTLVTDGVYTSATTSYNNASTDRQLVKYGNANDNQYDLTGLTTGTRYRVSVVSYRGGLDATINYNNDEDNRNALAAKLGGAIEEDQYKGLTEGFDASNVLQNPVNDKVEFNLFVFDDAMFDIQLHSSAGDMISMSNLNGAYGKGKHFISIPLSKDLANGSYFISISSGSEFITIPFVINK